MQHELVPISIDCVYILIPMCIVIDKKYTYQQSCRHFCKVLVANCKAVDMEL